MAELPVFYINLDHRTDRREDTLASFRTAEFPMSTIERFPAISHPVQYVGCTSSHIRCLEISKERGYKMVLIVEDDCTFYPGETYSKIIETVNKVPVWDVILLTASIYNFRSTPSVSKIEGVDKLLEGQAAAAYIVRDNYYDKLLENLRNSLAGLLDGKPEHIYAPDQQWKTLQSIDNWYIFSPIVAYQRPSYSDNSKVQGIYEFPRKLK